MRSALARRGHRAAPPHGPFAGWSRWTRSRRRQDRHRRGLRQADDLLVRHVRAGQQAALRRRDDGQPGRHRRPALGGRRSREIYKTLFGVRARHGRPGRGAAARRAPVPTALPTLVARRTAPSCPPEAGAGRRPGPASPPGLPAPDVLADRRDAGGPADERRLPARRPYTVPPARRGCPAARTATRSCAGSTGRCCSRSSAAARIGALLVWSATRQAAPRAPAATRTAPARSTCSTSRIGAGARRSARRRSTTACCAAYAPVAVRALAASACSPCSRPLGVDDQRLALVDRAAGGGFSLQPSEFAKVALVVGMAMLLARDARRRGHRRATVDVVLRARPAPPCRSA